MIKAIYDLDMTPMRTLPIIINVSQYDDLGRTLVFNLFSSSGKWTAPTSAAVTFEGGKPDGKFFAYNCAYSNGTVTVTIQQQMTAVAGKVRCKVKVTSGNKVVESAPIIMVVDAAAVPDGSDMSKSDINDAIANATQKIVDQVKDNIPSDYAQLSTDVSSLKEDKVNVDGENEVTWTNTEIVDDNIVGVLDFTKYEFDENSVQPTKLVVTTHNMYVEFDSSKKKDLIMWIPISVEIGSRYIMTYDSAYTKTDGVNYSDLRLFKDDKTTFINEYLKLYDKKENYNNANNNNDQTPTWLADSYKVYLRIHSPYHNGFGVDQLDLKGFYFVKKGDANSIYPIVKESYIKHKAEKYEYEKLNFNFSTSDSVTSSNNRIFLKAGTTIVCNQLKIYSIGIWTKSVNGERIINELLETNEYVIPVSGYCTINFYRVNANPIVSIRKEILYYNNPKQYYEEMENRILELENAKKSLSITSKYRYLVSTFCGSTKDGLILLGTNDLKTFDLVAERGIYTVNNNISTDVSNTLRDPAVLKTGEWYYILYTVTAFNTGNSFVGFGRTKDFVDFEELDNLSIFVEGKTIDYVWAPCWFKDGNDVYIVSTCNINSNFNTVVSKYNVDSHTVDNGTIISNIGGIDYHLYKDNRMYYMCGGGGRVYKSSEMLSGYTLVSTMGTTKYEADFIIKTDDGKYRRYMQELGANFGGRAQMVYQNADSLDGEWSEPVRCKYTNEAIEYIESLGGTSDKAYYFHWTIFDMNNRNWNNNNYID